MKLRKTQGVFCISLGINSLKLPAIDWTLHSNGLVQYDLNTQVPALELVLFSSFLLLNCQTLGFHPQFQKVEPIFTA